MKSNCRNHRRSSPFRQNGKQEKIFIEFLKFGQKLLETPENDNRKFPFAKGGAPALMPSNTELKNNNEKRERK